MASGSMAPNPRTIKHAFAPNYVCTFQVPDQDELNKRLLALVNEERRRSPESRRCEGREMWQSSRSVADDEPVKELFEHIFGAARDFADFLNWHVEGLRPVCKICWANIHPPGAFHTRHIHPPHVHMSGVYYIHAPENCGDIVFHDLARFLGLRSSTPPVVEPTALNRTLLAVKPADGLCVIFPSHIMHEVEVNRSAGDRVGFAFNINFE
ncbi:MAG: hypothetical protein QOJ70_3469 [Acidobacteriota bacterium]|nr:hypothetical protein [Acidobacteriota bacterium]MDT7809656.1 hypothetical protein [Acidobacteriota bacterium]